jgi:type I phosphodiesterase/nucleotide pyrophosphatase
MPNWKRLTAEGYGANLESYYPLISPILWTTAATGVGPDRHRVLDFQEVDPNTGRKMPISGSSRAVPAVWNAASAAGRKVGVVGWWATHTAEEVKGFFVSDHASPILFDKLPLSGVAFPTALEPRVAQIAERDGRVSEADLAAYLDAPSSEIAQALGSRDGMQNPIIALSRILAATRVTQRIGRDLYDRNHPDLMAVYFEGTDEVGHIFAPFTPPRPDCPAVSEADFAKYRRVVETYYGVIDRILGQWMRRAEEDGGTILLHSDHGFKWGIDRPCGLAAGSASTAAFWHRKEGVLVACGKGVSRQSERGRARLFDVAPTILALLGLPADRTMPGVPLQSAFPGLPVLGKKDLFSGLVVRRVTGAQVSAEQASEYAKKLLALGYLSPGAAAPLPPSGGIRPGLTEGAWNNLGMYEMETKRNLSAARADFEESLKLNPAYSSPMYNLALLCREKADTRAAEDWLFRALSALKANPAVAVGGWAREYQRDGKVAAARSLLERAATAYPDNEVVVREWALLLYRQKDCPGAVAALSRFEAATTEVETLNDLALFETCLANREAVIRLLERSLAIKPDQPGVAHSLETVRRASPSS